MPETSHESSDQAALRNRHAARIVRVRHLVTELNAHKKDIESYLGQRDHLKYRDEVLISIAALNNHVDHAIMQLARIDLALDATTIDAEEQFAFLFEAKYFPLLEFAKFKSYMLYGEDGKNVGIVRKNCIEYMNGVNLFMDKLDAICSNKRLVAITPDNADTLRSAMASIRETLQANIAQAAAELGRPVPSVMGEELVKWFEAIKPLMVTFMRDVIDQMMVEEPEAHTGDMSAQNTDAALAGTIIPLDKELSHTAIGATVH